MPRAATTSTPSAGGDDVKAAAQHVAGLLDDDGHYNPNPDQLSRGHPDYDESNDPRARDDKGRFKKADSAAPDDDDEEEFDSIDETEADEAQLADGDDRDEDTDEDGDADDDLAASAVEDTDADDAETDAIENIAQLAEALDVSVDELSEALTDTFTANGEQLTVTLAELRSGYQKDADYRQSKAKLVDDRKAFETQMTDNLQTFEKTAHEQAAQLAAFENILVEQLDNEQMRQLRRTDQAEWVARREEIGQRIMFIRQAREAARQQYDTTQTNFLQGLKERSIEAIKEAMPDYSTKHAETAKAVMQSVGYTDDEIGKIFDHRLIIAALELNTLREENAALKAEQAKAADAVKRVKKTVPRLVKSGKGKNTSKAAMQRSNVQKLQGRLKKSGKVTDAAKVIETMI